MYISYYDGGNGDGDNDDVYTFWCFFIENEPNIWVYIFIGWLAQEKKNEKRKPSNEQTNKNNIVYAHTHRIKQE